MTEAYRQLKAARPIRYRIAWVAYRLLWWPVAAVLIPFALIGVFVDWLSWTAFPAIAKVFQPVGGAAHAGALKVGHLILGYDRKKSA